MKKLIPYVLCMVLVLTNILTVVYFRHQQSEMRSASSFVYFAKTQNLPDGAAHVVNCLSDSGIEFREDKDGVKVREVDSKRAVTSCS